MATANSTSATTGAQGATHCRRSALDALSTEERITLLQEENAVLAEALDRLEQRQESPVAIGFDPFEFAMAFQHIEGLADTLLDHAPREHTDSIYSIRTIAQHFGGKLEAFSEHFGGSMPGTEGGAA